MFDLKDLMADAERVFKGTPTLEQMRKWVFSHAWGDLDWVGDLPKLTERGSYSRNILALEPIELVLLHWSPGAESAVHLHEGFWGFVVCLSGSLVHEGYVKEGSSLHLKDRVVAGEFGVLAEPDGTIHRLANGSADEPLMTLHLYAPALKDLKGLKLFDLLLGDVYTLADTAPAAVLNLDEEHYDSIEQGAFQYYPNAWNGSHQISPVVPKPKPTEVSQLLTQYYKAQATDYDRLDLMDARRHAYTKGINECIASRLQKLNQVHVVKEVLDLGCGTGRRAMEIRSASGLTYRIHGADLSPEMTAIAANRGLQMHPHFWNDNSAFNELDAVTFLYAFSHLSNREERLHALIKIHDALRPGGMLFVDVFNREDPHEWGPQLTEDFHRWCLGEQGYEVGDVFYTRTGTEQLAFLHYTNAEEMQSLLNEAGFLELDWMQIGYAHHIGQEVDEGGSLMFFATKT